MRRGASAIHSNMAGRTTLRGSACQKNTPRPKARNMLGQGQFSIYLPRRVDAEYYVRSPVKVKAEMLLSPDHLGGHSSGSIPCRARAEKLTMENGMSVVNVPIKIEAELLLTPGMSFSCKPATPQSPTPQDIHEGSSQVTKPLQVTESWELWGKKMKAALSKYRSQYGVKSENMWQTKQVLVSELRLDDNSAKTRELTKRINSYAAQVLEQNKRIRLLQARLREEEGGRAESGEKVCVVEQQCRLLEKRLKAAESRAMGAEHQAEAIKLRTRDLGVICGHQGVQLKELAKQVDFFAKILATQKVAALDTYKEFKQQLGMQTMSENEHLSAGVATSERSSSSSLTRTSNNRTFKIHSPLVELNYEPLLRRKPIVSEQENQHLLLPCCSVGSSSLRDRILTPTSVPRPNSECSESEQEGSRSHLGFLLDQLMQFAPNWDMEFKSSMKRAEELIQHCAVQASKLKDLSAELDCLGTRTRRERKPSPRVLFFEPQAYEIRSDSVESSPFRERPSSKSCVVSEATQGFSEVPFTADSMADSGKDVTFKTVDTSERTKSSVDKPILHKFTVIVKGESNKLESVCKKVLTDRSTQTLPVSVPLLPTLASEKETEPTRKCRHLPSFSSHSYSQMSRQAALRRASLPFRYELKMWRLAGQTLVQASLLWFGIRLLPQMQFFRFIPPAT